MVHEAKKEDMPMRKSHVAREEQNLNEKRPSGSTQRSRWNRGKAEV